MPPLGNLWTFTTPLAICLSILSSTVSPVIGQLPGPQAPSRHGTLTFQQSGHITRATFDNGPINLVDCNLIDDFLDFLLSLKPDNRTTPSPKVVIFDSANPNFFLGHIDLQLATTPLTPAKYLIVQNYIAITRLMQNITSTIFVAEINGRAFGAGQEFAIQMDMRFVGPQARTGSFEDAIGLTAGVGAQTILGSLIGKGRALEYVLAAKTFDGPTGTALGLFSGYFNTAALLRAAVDELAQRIALFPALASTKPRPSSATSTPPSAPWKRT